MEYLQYPRYVSSKIDSIQKTPSHWRQKKFRFLFNLGRGLGITKSNLVDKGIPCINYGEIHSKYGFEVVPERQTLKCVVKDYLETSPSSLLEFGDFVFADTSEDLEGSGNFSYLNSKVPTFAGYHTVVARLTEEELPRYIAYFFDSLVYRTQIKKSVSGVKVFSVTQSILKDSYLWLPPIDEQKQITKFLDYKTQQIDKLIKKKKKLIEKLEEKRIAVITQAVTKGLDPNVKLKSSGVDWLGDVPEHWISTKLKFLTSKIIDGAHFTPTYVSEGVPFLRVTDIVKSKGDGINLNNIKFIPESEHKELIRRCNPKFGDLLYSKNGTIGIAREVDWDWDFSIFVSLCLIKTEDKLYVKFLKYFLQSKVTQNQIAIGAKSNTVTNLHLDKIKEFISTCPPVEEQKSIVGYLDGKIKANNDLIKLSSAVVKKLQEYRSALITSAVTGKIDVRDINIPKAI